MAAFLPLTAQVAGSCVSQYETFFSQADPNGTGVVSAADAASFLKKSGLKESLLSQVWELSDPSGKGFLDKQSFFVAVKLIALAQNGRELNMANINVQMPPPIMGATVSPTMAPLGSLGNTWAIQAAEKSKYDQIFESLQPVNGLLSGDKVKPILINSKLPMDILGRVWDLSDLDKDGFLDREEFAVAMHLVYKALQKEPVPMTLPPDLVPPAKRKKSVIMGGVAVLPDLLGPATGPGSPGPKTLPPPFSIVGPPTSTTGPGGVPWVVTPLEKAKFDEMFKAADTDLDGYVNGLEIKDIFLQSGVPQNILAHIWNLCDTKGLGKLDSDQFALAMYLVQQKVNGVDVPQKLTQEMLPPSLRAPNAALDGACGIVTDYDTSGMKELDLISKEIEDIKRNKIKMEVDKTQKEADIRIRNGEVQMLQKELDAILITVKQLETQKGEAQKRLDELDDKRMKLENTTAEMKGKCNDEQKQIDKLRSQIIGAEMTTKNQEEELRKMRDGLNTIRQEEVGLDQKVEAGKTQLEQLGKSLNETQMLLTKSKAKVARLQETQNSINQCINQYNALITGDTTATEPDTSFIDAKEEPEDELNIKPTQVPSAFTSDLKSDPFKSRDSSVSDPFKADPFRNSSDPFKGKPLNRKGPEEKHVINEVDNIVITDGTPNYKLEDHDPHALANSDPFGSSVPNAGDDPFSDVFAEGSAQKKTSDTFAAFDEKPAANKNDPFGSDPFGATFLSAKTAKNDPFDPFGGSGSNILKSPINPEDPFGTGSFSLQPPNAKSDNTKTPTGRHKSPAPNLPPKQKKAPPPPRPPAPSKSSRGPSPAPGAKSDPFGSDPFNSSGDNTAPSAESFANFADFSQTKTSTEAQQMAWATKNSQKEWDKQRHLQEQEDADLELAIKLSKQAS